MKKAQNIIEVGVLLGLVVAVSLFVWPLFNNQKLKLVNTSNVTLIDSSGKSSDIIHVPPTVDPR